MHIHPSCALWKGGAIYHQLSLVYSSIHPSIHFLYSLIQFMSLSTQNTNIPSRGSIKKKNCFYISNDSSCKIGWKLHLTDQLTQCLHNQKWWVAVHLVWYMCDACISYLQYRQVPIIQRLAWHCLCGFCLYGVLYRYHYCALLAVNTNVNVSSKVGFKTFLESKVMETWRQRSIFLTFFCTLFCTLLPLRCNFVKQMHIK